MYGKRRAQRKVKQCLESERRRGQQPQQERREEEGTKERHTWKRKIGSAGGAWSPLICELLLTVLSGFELAGVDLEQWRERFARTFGSRRMAAAGGAARDGLKE